MRPIIFIFIIFFVFHSCKKDPTKKPTDFIISNTCGQKVNSYTCAMSNSQLNGSQEICFPDIIYPGKTISLRKLDCTDDITIPDVFTSISITKNAIPATKDPFDDALWVRSEKDGTVSITLTVDSLFFK